MIISRIGVFKGMELHQRILRGHYLYFGYYWLYEQIMDRKIGGKVLNEMLENDDYCNSFSDNEWHPVQSTSYRLLILAIKYIYVNQDDVFVDVGCGFGRIISYLIIKHRKCRYIGIDINKAATDLARKRFENCPDVTIIRDNVLNCIPKDASIFYLFNPFGANILDKFLQKVEDQTVRNIKLIYLNPVHKNIFEHHKQWQLTESIILTPKFHLPIEMNIYELKRNDF